MGTWLLQNANLLGIRHSCGTSPFLIGKSSIIGPISIAIYTKLPEGTSASEPHLACGQSFLRRKWQR